MLGALGVYRTVVRVHQAMVGRKWAHEREMLREFYAPLLRNVRLIFDIGANKGYYSSVFASLGARVVAVEPNPDCVRHIERSYPEVEVIQAVAGPKDGLAEVNLSDVRDDMSSASEEWVRAQQRWRPEIRYRKLAVPMLRLDTLIEHYAIPEYIKIDVEGSEEGVLHGLSFCPGLLSFDFTSAFLEMAFRCLSNPMFEGASFNFTVSEERNFWIKGEWMDAESIKAMLPKLSTLGHYYGDIFIRKQ